MTKEELKILFDKTESDYDFGKVHEYAKPNQRLFRGEKGFCEKWETGGASGGNCWDGQAEYYESNESPKELESFYQFLHDNFTNISFLQVREILKTCVKEFEYEDVEYYGNYTDYKGIYITFKDLYESLVKLKIVS